MRKVGSGLALSLLVGLLAVFPDGCDCGGSNTTANTGTGGGAGQGIAGTTGTGGKAGAGGAGGKAGEGGAAGQAGAGGASGAGGTAGAGNAGKIGTDAAVDAAVSVGSCAGVSLLGNCSFELPVTAGAQLFSSDAGIGAGDAGLAQWTVVGAAGNVNTINTTFTQNGFSFVAEDGQQSMDLTGTSNTATGVAQTVATTKGTRYTLSFWVGNVVDSGGIFGTTSTVDVLIDGTQVLAAENDGGSGTTTLNWKQFSWEFIAASTATTISFISGDPSSDTSNFIDNVILSVASVQ